MPDLHVSSPTILPVFDAPAVVPAGTSIMDGYRSPLIGKLVAARAKATASIKAIIKDKTAKVPTKDGRSYSYAYVDLAGVLDAVSDALAEQELVIVQTTQVRATGTYLLTSLLHSSEQWLASELRLNATSAGPQAFGSELTYLRRYATLGILGLAPEDDDDGAAAQDRADQGRHRQQHRQEGRQRAQDAPETPRGTARSAPASAGHSCGPHRPDAYADAAE